MEYKLLKQNLNYDDIVTGKDLDFETYEKKFKMWDSVIDNNMLETQPELIHLQDDPTIFAYANFKDDEGQPFKLTAYQDVIVNCKHDFTPNNPNKLILFLASNQIGKSKLLGIMAIYHALREDNVNIVMVSKSLPQSQYLLATIRHTLNNSVWADKWKEGLGETANTTILTFDKGQDGKIINRIICCPSGEGLLGYPCHYLYLDEADFYENSRIFFYKIAHPRTKKTKGQLIIFSNPNAEISRSVSLLWELWNGDLFQRKFTFNFLDAPWNTIEEYERDKRNTPNYIFESTHNGCFSEEGGAFLSHREIQQMLQRDWINELPAVEGTVYCALDLGKMNDQTILSLGISKKPLNTLDKYNDLDVRYTEEFPLRTDYDIIANRMLEIREHYKQFDTRVIFGFDATGQKTFGDLLKRMGISATPVDFARKESNKTLLYNDFKLMVENGKIKVVYSSKCEKQLADLTFKLTELKRLKKVEAKTQSVHDDYPDSLAILVHIAVKPSKFPVTAVSVSKNTVVDIRKANEQLSPKEVAMKLSLQQNKPEYLTRNRLSVRQY